MKRLKTITSIFIASVLILMTGTSSQAHDPQQIGRTISAVCEGGSNVLSRFEWPSWLDLPALQNDQDVVMQNKAGDGWQVSWAKEKIDYDDYFKLSCAIYGLINDEDTEPLAEFFEEQLDTLIEDLDQAVASMGKSALRDLLVKAFLSQGQIIKNAGFEIDAGIAEYHYWYDITWLESCKYEFPSGGWTWVPCKTEKKIEWLPKYQMYIRYRTTELPTVAFETVQQIVDSELHTDMTVEEQTELITSAIFRAIQEKIPQVTYVEAYEEIRKKINQASNQYSDPDQIIDEALRQVMADLSAIADDPQTIILDFAESNRAEVQNRIKSEDGGNWHIVWGVNMNEIEDAKLTAAIVGSIFTGGKALQEYFDDYLDRTLKRIRRQAPELETVVQEAVEDAINDIERCVESGFDGDHCEGAEVCFTRPDKCFNKIEIKAGIATYDRHTNLIYNEPRSKKERWEFGDLGWMDGFRLTTELVSYEVNMPNHHQPYIKFRFKEGSSAVPDGPPQSTASLSRVLYDSQILHRNSDINLSEVYVERGAVGDDNGSPEDPFSSVSRGIIKVKPEGIVYIKPGHYDGPVIIAKPITLRKWGDSGAVIIGQ